MRERRERKFRGGKFNFEHCEYGKYERRRFVCYKDEYGLSSRYYYGLALNLPTRRDCETCPHFKPKDALEYVVDRHFARKEYP